MDEIVKSLLKIKAHSPAFGAAKRVGQVVAVELNNSASAVELSQFKSVAKKWLDEMHPQMVPDEVRPLINITRCVFRGFFDALSGDVVALDADTVVDDTRLLELLLRPKDTDAVVVALEGFGKEVGLECNRLLTVKQRETLKSFLEAILVHSNDDELNVSMSSDSDEQDLIGVTRANLVKVSMCVIEGLLDHLVVPGNNGKRIQ